MHSSDDPIPCSPVFLSLLGSSKDCVKDLMKSIIPPPAPARGAGVAGVFGRPDLDFGRGGSPAVDPASGDELVWFVLLFLDRSAAGVAGRLES